MGLALLAVVVGLVILVWSADRFVDGAAVTARHFGMPSLLIGMVVVGFGTSAPEMVVSLLASLQGNPGIALGNAYGSNITNIALILGIAALITPLTVDSQVIRKELPVLAAVTALTVLLLWNGILSRLDAVMLVAVFAGLMAWSIREGFSKRKDPLGEEFATELEAGAKDLPLRAAVFWLVVGLLALVLSSRMLVWGAEAIAQSLGVSDLIIGLTIVAVGTSLPELASSVIAARKGEDDIALGNVIGSNLFNTLAVVGIAGLVAPLAVPPEVLSRDVLVMSALTVSLFVLGYGFRGQQGRIGRVAGGMLVFVFVGYTAFLVSTQFVSGA